MKFGNQSFEINSLYDEATSLNNALTGLSIFTNDRFTDTNISIEDLDGLRGLLGTISSLASQHYENMGNYYDFMEEKAND